MRSLISFLLVGVLLVVGSSSSSSFVAADAASSALAFLSIPAHVANAPQAHFADAHTRAAHLVSQQLPLLHSQFSHLFNQLHSRFNQHHAQFHALATNASSGSTVTCSSALTMLQAKIAACGLPWVVNSSSTSMSSSSSPSALASIITTMCSTGTCAMDISSLIQVAGSSCSIPPAAFASVQGFLRASCVRDSAGTLCLPQFLNSTSIFSSTQNPFSTGTAISNNILNSLCSSCTMIVVNLFLGFSTSTSTSSSTSLISASTASNPQQIAASFNILCIKDPSDTTGQTYCINKLISVFASTSTTAAPSSACSSSSSTSSSPPSAAMIDAMCSPCMRRLLFLIQNSTSSSSSSSSTSSTCTTASSSTSISSANIFALLDNFCAFNQNGQRCFSVILNFASAGTSSLAQTFGSACSNSFGPGQTCQASCSSALQQSLVAPLGCCLGSLFSILGSDPAIGTVVTSIFSTCGITLSPCHATTPVTASINLPALSYAWCNSHDATCKADLQTDISNAAFVSSSSVTVVYSPTASGGTQVAVTILPASNVDAVAAQNSLNSALSSTSTGISFTQTTSAAAATGGLIASASTSGTIMSSSNGTTTATGATNPSMAFANASPNLFVLLAAMLALAAWLN